MKEITLFILKGCPHCILANKLIEQLCKEDKRYADVVIRRIDERENKKLANAYDYWYVPSFYIGKQKLHEGHAEHEDVKAVLQAAIDS